MKQTNETTTTKPTGRIELLDASGKRKYLTSEEREQFYQAARKQPLAVRTFCHFLYWTGCHISEALEVMRSSVDMQNRVVVIETLKKRRKGVFRQIPLPDKFLDEMNVTHRLTKPHKGEKRSDWKLWDWSRRTATRRVEEVMQAAGIEGIQASAKGVRHAFAIECLKKNVPLNMVSKWLGHASINTTAVYASTLEGEERSIAEKLWNR